MPVTDSIKYLPQQEIDKLKWDACITKAANGLVYGFSFYLDHMARHWDALVLNDYEAVLPLTWNKKYSIYYLYQPFLCAQLGVFGNAITKERLQQFLEVIPRKFRYWDISLNHQNRLPVSYPLTERVNYVLDLSPGYDELYKGYRDTTKRNIRKAVQLQCRTERNIEAAAVIELAAQQLKTYADIKIDFENFSQLYALLQAQQKATTYGIIGANGQLLASCVFFFSHQRAYYILVGNHPNGKTVGASHALIDAFIKDHAGQPLLLDFEGSDIRNLAFFYSSFGAVEEKYAAVKLNRLPFYLKWLKQ